MSFTTLSVTGTVERDGAPAAGYVVRLDLSSPISDGSTEIGGAWEATCDDSGVFSVADVPANDDDTTVPVGTYYVVTVRSGGSVIIDRFLVIVPAASAPSVDLFSLAQLDDAPSPATPFVVSIEGLNGIVGITSPDSSITVDTDGENITLESVGGAGMAIGAPVSGATHSALLAADSSGDLVSGPATSSVASLSNVAAAQAAAEAASDPVGSASTAQTNAESFATSAVATETSRAETAEGLLAPKASPALTGTPTAPTATALDSSTKLATTAYADAAVGVESSRALTVEALKAPIASPTFTGTTTAPEFSASGLTGATQASRYVGATTSGAPASGTFVVGDFVIARNGHVFVCTAGGSPGTWVDAGSVANLITSVFGRTGGVTAQSGDYTAAQVTNTADKSSGSQQAFTSEVAAPDFAPSGLTGATAAGRYVGATTSGAPASGTFLKGDWVTTQNGHVFVCTTAGSPGTWTDAGSVANLVTSVFGRAGAVTATSGDYSVAQVTGAAPAASPAFTGTPTAPTASALDSSTKLATTAYADAAVGVENTRATTAEALKAPIASPTFTGTTTAPEFSASGLTGAIQASRYAGATTSGAPASGTFAVGDFVVARNGHMFVCTSAGTPGTWVDVGSVGNQVTSVFGRTGVVAAASADYTAAQVTNAADKSSGSQQAFTAEVAAPDFAPAGLTGATAAGRYVGATTSGAPASGTFLKGDWVITQNGHILICTTAGSPGTWKDTVPQQLGYAEITSNFTTTVTTPTDAGGTVTGLSLTVAVGARPVRVWFYSPYVQSTVSGDTIGIQLYRGTTPIGGAIQNIPAANTGPTVTVPANDNPAAGTYTYTVQLWRAAGSGTVEVGAFIATGYYLPASLRVEEVAA